MGNKAIAGYPVRLTDVSMLLINGPKKEARVEAECLA
jgi:hypothetical protein